MKTPFRLRRREETAPTAGLLLLTDDVDRLLALYGRLRTSAPTIHGVAGGFLLVLRGPSTGRFPGAIRLRRLCDRLFLPIDADLEPALFDDEAAALVREHGLIFLPDGRVLGYNPHSLFTLSELIAVPPVQRKQWRPLPEGPPLAERLREVALDLPLPEPEAILQAGSPNRSSPATPTAGEAAPGRGPLGRFFAGLRAALAWLGGLFRGGKSGSRKRSPKPSEDLLRRQEKRLRQLLREFREGDTERALREALPLGGADRGGEAARDAHLPPRNTTFSLASLLGLGRRPPSVWQGGGNVQILLAEEYRKAAAAAAARGDHRRAAYIYGLLLHDFRMAANLLAGGGRHREAAILYLEKLNDERLAARSFEAAGELDRAVVLYRRCGEHERAGDLLRRAGEHEAALVEYLAAADDLVHKRDNHLAAGALLAAKAHRPDLALVHYEAGWRRRPLGDSHQCLLRLLDIHVEDERHDALFALLDEAEDYYRQHGSDNDVQVFFTAMVSLAERRSLANQRDGVRDRARLSLAAVLRRRAAEEVRPGDLVATLLGRSGLWSAEMVADAEAACLAATERTKRRGVPAAARVVWIETALEGRLSAACSALESGEVFLGSDRGEVVAFHPESSGFTLLARHRRHRSPVMDLATDSVGNVIVALVVSSGGRQLRSLNRSESSSGDARRHSSDLLGVERLTPVALWDGEPALGAWGSERIAIFHATQLTPLHEGRFPRLQGVDALSAVHLAGSSLFLCFAAGSLVGVRTDGASVFRAAYGWSAPPEEGPLPPLSVLHLAVDVRSQLLVSRTAPNGGPVCWARFGQNDQGAFERTGTAVRSGVDYRAAALLGPTRLAAVTDDAVHWLRSDGRRLIYDRQTRGDFQDVAACFLSPRTRELIVVCRRGRLARVLIPY